MRPVQAASRGNVQDLEGFEQTLELIGRQQYRRSPAVTGDDKSVEVLVGTFEKLREPRSQLGQGDGFGRPGLPSDGAYSIPNR